MGEENCESNLIKVDYSQHMRESFLIYAKDVLEDRALPSVTDGLKPVHRRILASMYGLGLHPNGAFKKCARTVGDVLGRMHPHGDASVYDAMVILAQDFNTKYPLVHGHGNFGDVDGDPAAAMRYTEAKLSLIGELIMTDINKDTVDMKLNYDESEHEPVELPGLFPTLLANGTTGIAVGMGSSFPPHKVSDVYAALDKMLADALEGKETTIDDLIAIIKAPDFPSGGEILGLKDVHKGYREGRGRVVIRSKYSIEDIGKDREAIVITEIPYKVNKARMVVQIDDLRKNELSDIKEVRDESDKDGIRVVIELKKGANTQWIIKKLLKHTDMQSSFGMNHVALVDGKPVENLTLQDILEYFLAHAMNVVQRRTQYDLNKANQRMHLVNGARLALLDIDGTISTIRAAKKKSEAIATLMEMFGIDDVQAKYIIDMGLWSISEEAISEFAVECEKLDEMISKFNAILGDEMALIEQVRVDLAKTAERFSKEDRLSEICMSDGDEASERDLVKEESLVVTYTNRGIIKSVKESEYQAKGRRNKGQKAGNLKEDDSVRTMLTLTTKDDILFITNFGKCHVLPAFKIPISTKTGAGKYISNYLDLDSEEKIVSILSTTANNKEQSLFMVTKNGTGKRLELQLLSSRLSYTRVITLAENDELAASSLIDKEQEAIAITAGGMLLRFNPNDEKKGIRPTGRTASGVRAIRLKEFDYVVDVLVGKPEETFLLMTENGFAKRCNFGEMPIKSRGSQGVTILKASEKTGVVVSAIIVEETDDLFIASASGKLSRIAVSGIPLLGRTATGVRTINLDSEDSVVSISNNTGETEDADDEEGTEVA